MLKVKKYIIITVLLLFVVGLLYYGLSYNRSRTFTSEKWMMEPDQRGLIVNDLLREYSLIGMTEDEIIDLLGVNDNDRGYYLKEDRFVYFLGLEGQLFKIDDQWLCIDFIDGIVSDYSIVQS